MSLWKLPLYLGGTKLSTKWRRSKKCLKWLYPNGGSERGSARNRSKTVRVKKMRTTSAYSQKNRYSKNRENKWGEPKPLIDIFQEDDWIIIIAQIAGFNKETLKINVQDQKLTLSAKTKDRRYYKSLNLPRVVIPNIMHTAYKNGVLEIKLKKAMKEQIPSQEAD